MAPQGGFAVITNAPDSRSAKRQATFTYAKYAAGQLSFELEIRQQTDSGPTARTTARRGRSWWPWSRAVEAAPVEHLGNFPII